MVEIRDLESIIEYTYLLAKAPHLLSEDIIVNPTKGELLTRKVVILNKRYDFSSEYKPLVIIDRSKDLYDFDYPNKFILGNNLINPFQNRVVTKWWSRFVFNHYLLPEAKESWDSISYLRYQLGLTEESQKLYVFKEYEFLKMKKTEITDFKRLLTL